MKVMVASFGNKLLRFNRMIYIGIFTHIPTVVIFME